MLTTLVLTIIGADRPGIVQRLAAQLADHGGNWLESRMGHLGGQFAGILRAEVPAERAEELLRALRTLEADGLRLIVQTESAIPPPAAGLIATLDLVGQDRPGILREISAVLAAHHVNVEELASERVCAPMDGTMLFQARATVLLPTGVTLGALRGALERIAADLMVDVRLRPPGE